MPATWVSGTTPALSASATSPPSVSAAGVSTCTTARRTASSSASRIARLKAPTRSRWAPRLQPRALHDRLGRERRAGDEVGLAHRRLEIRRGPHRQALAGELGRQRLGALGPVVPERDLADRPLARCARIRNGASAPAPTITMRVASSRARKRAASAEAAAVRHRVSRVPSSAARGAPVSPSIRR